MLALRLLCCAALAAVAARAAPTPGKTPRQLLKEHVSRVMAFKCAQPQPRAVASASILEANNRSLQITERVQPLVTVLHRCDGAAGCCLERGYECGPAEMQAVALTFLFLNANSSNSTEEMLATNHTRCSCQPAQRPPLLTLRP